MKEIISDRYSQVQITAVNQEARKDPAAFVTSCEAFYNNQVEEAAKQIRSGNNRYKFVLLCGPSASGKTTTAHKLKHRLIKQGTGCRVLSMDNFFTGMKNYPLWEDGTPNMESIDAMDIPMLNEKFTQLLETGKAMFPVFDFATQERTLNAEKFTLTANDVLIMEGIHALNPNVLKGIPKENVFRMHVSVRTKFTDGDTEILRPADIRLLRRMVRDHQFRSYPPLKTLEYWHVVRANEITNINPYRDDVDLKMDNTLDYEVCVWRALLQELVEDKKRKELVEHVDLVKVLEGLLAFEQMDFDLIPKNSLLREFIGNSI